STDNITNDNTPTFGVAASPYLRFYRGTTLISGSFASGSTFTPSAQADGTFAYKVSAVDDAGNESAASTALNVTIDAAAPAAPDLQAASDSAVPPTDNITNDNTPTFDVAATPYFRLYRASTLLSGAYQSGSSFTPSAQADGTSAYTLTAVDDAGNESAAS